MQPLAGPRIKPRPYQNNLLLQQIRQALLAEMHRQRLSFAQLARNLNVSGSTIWRMLCSESDLQISTIVWLATALDCELQISLVAGHNVTAKANTVLTKQE